MSQIQKLLKEKDRMLKKANKTVDKVEAHYKKKK